MTPPSHLPEQTDPAVAPSEGLAPARKPTGHVPEGAAAEIAWQIRHRLGQRNDAIVADHDADTGLPLVSIRNDLHSSLRGFLP